MKYYISISAWNLLESFTTESISPVAFYAERAYGAKLSRFLEDKFDRTYKLVLSTKDNGGDYTIEVDEELIDKSLLAPERIRQYFLILRLSIIRKVWLLLDLTHRELWIL